MKRHWGGDGRGRHASGRGALASLSLAMLLSSLGTSIANVGLPTLAQAFDASFQAVQWVVLAYLLAMTTLIVGVGRLGDMFGRRRLLLAGIGLFTAASVLCGVAPTLWLLIAARAAQGLGAAIMMALAMALVGETVAKARTGSAMGLLGTMSAIGTALGPSLGGVLIAGSAGGRCSWSTCRWGWWPWCWRGVICPSIARSRRTGAPASTGRGTLVLALTSGLCARDDAGARRFGAFNGALLGRRCRRGCSLAEAMAAAPLIRPALFRDRGLRAGWR